MSPADALAEIKAWRKRDPDAHAAVRALLDSFHYQNLDALFEADPGSVLELREALVPLMEMDDTFATEDALNREGRRDLTGRVIALEPPSGAAVAGPVIVTAVASDDLAAVLRNRSIVEGSVEMEGP